MSFDFRPNEGLNRIGKRAHKESHRTPLHSEGREHTFSDDDGGEEEHTSNITSSDSVPIGKEAQRVSRRPLPKKARQRREKEKNRAEGGSGVTDPVQNVVEGKQDNSGAGSTREMSPGIPCMPADWVPWSKDMSRSTRQQTNREEQESKEDMQRHLDCGSPGDADV